MKRSTLTILLALGFHGGQTIAVGEKIAEAAENVVSGIKETAEHIGEKLSPIVLNRLRVHNESSMELYAALYLSSPLVKDMPRASDIEKIAPGAYKDIQKMPNAVGQRIVVSLDKEDLKPKLTIGEAEKLLVGKQGKMPILPVAQYPELFVVSDEGQVKILTSVEWRLKYPITQVIRDTALWESLGQRRKELQKQFIDKRYDKVAMVTEGTALSVGEQSYLRARLPKIKVALEKMLDTTVEKDEIPRIAFCCSGGGHRAMYAMVGWMKGAEQIGLLDASVYAAVLSGSSRFLTLWMASGLTLNNFYKQLLPRTEKSFREEDFDVPLFEAEIFKKYIFGQPLSIIDVYGGLITQKFLTGYAANPYSITLADQVKRVADGNMIYPIYTAVLSEREYEWMEFTPHVIGSDYLNAYVPSWSFGRKFDNGKSVDLAPPQSLGFFMGIWGSAFSATLRDILEIKADQVKPAVLRNALIAAPFSEKRPLSAAVLNFTRGMKGPYGLKDQLHLVDAGIAINLPLPVVIKKQRKVDIIIMLDASEPDIRSQFELAIDYGIKKGHKLPKIGYQETRARKKSCVVFKGDDDSTPTIIYMPFVKNEGYSALDPDAIQKERGHLATFNLWHTEEQAADVVGLAEFSMRSSKDLIVEAIRSKVVIKKNMKKAQKGLPQLNTESIQINDETLN